MTLSFLIGEIMLAHVCLNMGKITRCAPRMADELSSFENSLECKFNVLKPD